MDIPDVSRDPAGPLSEIVLGRGDYVAGGARSLPFLDLDGARHRRPMVFGKITDDLSEYPELAASMFSGRQTDPEEWAVMWKEIGADGIWIDLKKGGADLVRRISDRTRLPIAVHCSTDAMADIAAITGHVMILVPEDGSIDGRDHVVAIPAEVDREFSEKTVIDLGRVSLEESLGEGRRLAGKIRRMALDGCPGMDRPLMADVSGDWTRRFADARSASMWEAETALVMMLAGADIVVTVGPGAADMARVYGEELADL